MIYDIVKKHISFDDPADKHMIEKIKACKTVDELGQKIIANK